MTLDPHQTIRVVLVQDSPPARSTLQNYIAPSEDVEIVAAFARESLATYWIFDHHRELLAFRAFLETRIAAMRLLRRGGTARALQSLR